MATDRSKIEWTEATWNPVRGCSRISDGCRNCYAERVASRFAGTAPFAGFAASTPSGPRWTGKVELIENMLDQPIRWRRPRLIFVNSMSDIFHESLPDAAIRKVFSVMLAARHHFYQVLTKRAGRMASLLAGADWWAGTEPEMRKHIWLGVSVEDQAAADHRIPALMRTPAALRFVSAEPLLEEIRIRTWVPALEIERETRGPGDTFVDWVIVGGESGPGARRFDIQWARTLIADCRMARVPIFVKQLGSRPVVQIDGSEFPICNQHRKSGEPSEWAEDLRVRELPPVPLGREPAVQSEPYKTREPFCRSEP